MTDKTLYLVVQSGELANLFPDDFDIVTLILQVLHMLMISEMNIFDSHGVSIFVFNSRVSSVS